MPDTDDVGGRRRCARVCACVRVCVRLRVCVCAWAREAPRGEGARALLSDSRCPSAARRRRRRSSRARRRSPSASCRAAPRACVLDAWARCERARRARSATRTWRWRAVAPPRSPSTTRAAPTCPSRRRAAPAIARSLARAARAARPSPGSTAPPVRARRRLARGPRPMATRRRHHRAWRSCRARRRSSTAAGCRSTRSAPMRRPPGQPQGADACAPALAGAGARAHTSAHTHTHSTAR